MDIFKWTDTYVKDFYTWGHIVQIVLMAMALVAAGFIFNKRKNLENKMYIFLAISTNAITLITLLYSIITGVYHLEWYIPLHICNLFIIISVLSCIFKKKVRKFLNEYMVFCGLGGCFIGIIIPASTLYYLEPYSFVAMLVWVYHLIIGVMAIYLITSGVFKVKMYNCWKAFVILVPLAIGAIVANHFLNTNFIGLNRFKPIFGLELIANATGKFYPLVLIGGVLTLSGILAAVTACFAAHKTYRLKKLNAL